MNFIARLMPREGRFFALFDNHAKLIVDGALALADVMRHYDVEKDRAAGINLIEEVEHSADRITHETVQLLHTTFVTPFDRDDIHRLISRMDDVLDLIQDTGESLVLYDIQKVTPEATQLAELLLRCTERVQSAVKLMASMADAPAMLALCQEIDKLESDADKVMRGAISRLFREETDVRQVIKLKAVYESLESATDKCQDVANVIESVVLENA
jgi:predicted phosphate transport protein (TIGR00153 family)